ncbi:HPr kinase/phosphorylase [Litorisediminicola beolgyonensis]
MRLHASAVALSGRGVLILGSSGAGKSALALALIARGARLIADDAVEVRTVPEGLHLSCPEAGRGLIEARGVGLLRAEPVEALAALVVDLDQDEAERLPPARSYTILSHPLPLLGKSRYIDMADAIPLCLTGGRREGLDP